MRRTVENNDCRALHSKTNTAESVIPFLHKQPSWDSGLTFSERTDGRVEVKFLVEDVPRLSSPLAEPSEKGNVSVLSHSFFGTARSPAMSSSRPAFQIPGQKKKIQASQAWKTELKVDVADIDRSTRDRSTRNRVPSLSYIARARIVLPWKNHGYSLETSAKPALTTADPDAFDATKTGRRRRKTISFWPLGQLLFLVLPKKVCSSWPSLAIPSVKTKCLWNRNSLSPETTFQTWPTDYNQGEGALLDFVEAREVVGSCTSPDQWAILQQVMEFWFCSKQKKSCWMAWVGKNPDKTH